MSESDKPVLVDEKVLYEGRIFNLTSAKVEHGAIGYTREIIRHTGSAVVLPIHGNGDITLVKQFRVPVDDFIFEVPAGTIDVGESPEECAQREILEETGLRAGSIEKINEFFVSPGFLDEKMHLFFASDLTVESQNLDEDEFLSIERLARGEVESMLDSGNIIDAKTIIALTKYLHA